MVQKLLDPVTSRDADFSDTRQRSYCSKTPISGCSKTKFLGDWTQIARSYVLHWLSATTAAMFSMSCPVRSIRSTVIHGSPLQFSPSNWYSPWAAKWLYRPSWKVLCIPLESACRDYPESTSSSNTETEYESKANKYVKFASISHRTLYLMRMPTHWKKNSRAVIIQKCA